MNPFSRLQFLMLCRHRAAQITINRPHKRNAFTPLTVREMSLCFADARDDPAIGVVVLTGDKRGFPIKL